MFEWNESRVERLEARIKDLTYAYRNTLTRYGLTNDPDSRWLIWRDLKYYNKQIRNCIKELAKHDNENNDGPRSA